MQHRKSGRGLAPMLLLAALAAGFVACNSGSSGSARMRSPADGALVGGSTGAVYDLQLEASGTPPFVWSLVDGELPPGLSLEVDTGRIRGTPSAAGEFTFTVEVRNAAGSDRRSLTMAVVAAPVAPTVLTTMLGDATVGQGYAQTLLAGGTAPLAWSVASGALPAGLALGAETGVLAGTPTAAGAATFTVAVTNAAGTDTQELTLTVHAAPTAPSIQDPGEIVEGVAQLPPATHGAIYLRGFQASGTTPIAWSVVAGALPDGLQLDAEAGVLGGVPSAPGEATFTVRASNVAGHDDVACRLVVAEAPSLSSVSPSSAPRGATVVVSGTGFTAGEPTQHVVAIGGHLAHVIAASATELRVEVPEGASETATIVLAGAAPGGDPVTLTVLELDVGFVDVDATGGENDGSSWRNAYTGLDAALAGGHDELWIAAGVYRPADPTVPSFAMHTDQQLLGGFAATEGAAAQRDPLANLTVLSGDLLGDDGQQGGSLDDNVPQVVHITGGSAVLDGLVIERGYARAIEGSGANLRVENAALALRNCIVRDGRCDAGDGAGLWASNSDVDIDRCVFQSNRVTHGLDGGGYGGGIYFLGCAGAECHRTVFESNRADYGGGTYTKGLAVPIRGCVFVGNQAMIGGGAHGSPSNTIYDCTFVGNEAMLYGGGFSATGGVAGIISVSGCVFEANFAFDHGTDVGVEHIGEATATIRATRLVNGIDGIYYHVQSDPFTDGGRVHGWSPPFFVDAQNPRGADGLWGTHDDGLILDPYSQLIDLGYESALPTDLRGVARPQGLAAELGAYESIHD